MRNSKYLTLLLTGLAGTSTSVSVRAATTTPLQIISEPADTTVGQGENVALTVQAAGSPAPTFQWALNGELIPGAVGPTFVLKNVQPTDSGSYSVFIQNDNQSLQSDPAAITVNAPALPFSDKITGRGTIRGLTGFGRGNNAAATSELLEPWTLAGVKHSAWVSWIAPKSGIATFSTAGSGFDTVVGSFQAISLPLLPPVLLPLAVDDESGDYHTSEIRFNVEAGKEYVIGVGSGEENGGNIMLSWQLEAGASIPLIVLPPSNQTVNYGESAAFSISVQSLLAPIFQWFKNDIAIPGANGSRLNILEVSSGDVGRYHCSVKVLGISILSSDAELQVNTEGLKAGARNKLSEAILTGIKGRSSVSAASTKIRAFDISGSAGYSGTQVFQNYPGKDPGEPNHCGVAGGASYWLSYTAPSSGVLTLTTDGSSFDTVLAVYGSNGGSSYASLYSVACDNNSGADGRDSRVVFNATANTTYYIAIDGVNAATGTVYLSYSLNSNSAPTVGAISSISMSEDGAAVARSFTVNDKETAPGNLQVTVSSSNPALASVALGGSNGSRSLTVQPSANRNGSATITVTVRDAGGLAASTSFTLNVSAVNDAPIANTDSGTCKKNSTVAFYAPSLLANDSDPDGNALSLYSIGGATNFGGKLARSGDYIYYTAPANFTGTDYFSYTVADGQGAYASTRVFIAVAQ